MNPENTRACIGCKHLEATLLTVELEFDGEMYDYSKKVLRCSKLDKYVHPPVAEHSKKGPYDLGHHVNHPMPKECDSFGDIFGDRPFP
jgi:hypothetical protein